MNDVNDILNNIKLKFGTSSREITESGGYSAAGPSYESRRYNVQAHPSYGSENAGHTMFHSNTAEVNTELLLAALAAKSRLGSIEERKSDASALSAPRYYEDFPSSAGLSSTGLLPRSEQQRFNYGRYSGSFAEIEQEPVSTPAYSNQMQSNPLTLDLDDIDDEDEFLYGKSEDSSALKERVFDQNKVSDPFGSNTSYFGQRSNFLEVDSDYQASSVKFTKPIVINTKLPPCISKCHSEWEEPEEVKLSLLNTSRNTGVKSGLSNTSVEEKMRLPLEADESSSYVTDSLRESDKMHIPSSIAGNRPPSDKTRKSRFDQKPDTPLPKLNNVNTKADMRCRNNSPEADQCNQLLLNKKEINDSVPSELLSHPLRNEIDLKNISMNLKSLFSSFSESHSKRKINILSQDADYLDLNEVSDEDLVSLPLREKASIPAKKNSLQALNSQKVVAIDIERNVSYPEQLQSVDYRAKKSTRERYCRSIEVARSNSNKMNVQDAKRKAFPDNHGNDRHRYTNSRREHLHDRTDSRHKKNYSPMQEKHKDSRSRHHKEECYSKSSKRHHCDRSSLDHCKSYSSRKDSTERRSRRNRWSRSRSREVSRSPLRYRDCDESPDRHSSTGTPRRLSPDNDSCLSGDSKADLHHHTLPRNCKKEDLVGQSSSSDKYPSKKAKGNKNNKKVESEPNIDNTETVKTQKIEFKSESITAGQIYSRTAKTEIIFDKNESPSMVQSLDVPDEKSTADKIIDFFDRIMQNKKAAADITKQTSSYTSSVPIVDTSDSSSFVYNEPIDIDTNVTSQITDPLLTSYIPNYGYVNPSMCMPPYVNNSLTYGSNMPYNYQAPVQMHDPYMPNPYYQHTNCYPIPNPDMAPMISPPDVSRNAYKSKRKSIRVSSLKEVPVLKNKSVINQKMNLKSQSLKVNKNANEERENPTDNLSLVQKGEVLPLEREESFFLKESPTAETCSPKKHISNLSSNKNSDAAEKLKINIIKRDGLPVEKLELNVNLLSKDNSAPSGTDNLNPIEKECQTPVSEDSSASTKKKNIFCKVNNEEDVIIKENKEPRSLRQTQSKSPEKSNENDASTSMEKIAKPTKEISERVKRVKLSNLDEQETGLRSSSFEMARKDIEIGINVDSKMPILKETESKSHELEKSCQKEKTVEVEILKEVKNEPRVIKTIYCYADYGGHWCEVCNRYFMSIQAKLSHLQTFKHKQLMAPIERPCSTPEGEEETNSSEIYKQWLPLKGMEFVTPLCGFYCTLCEQSSADEFHAVHHLKSHEHHQKYYQYLGRYPNYEKKYDDYRRFASGVDRTLWRRTISSCIGNLGKCKNKGSLFKRVNKRTEKIINKVKRLKMRLPPLETKQVEINPATASKSEPKMFYNGEPSDLFKKKVDFSKEVPDESDVLNSKNEKSETTLKESKDLVSPVGEKSSSDARTEMSFKKSAIAESYCPKVLAESAVLGDDKNISDHELKSKKPITTVSKRNENQSSSDRNLKDTVILKPPILVKSPAASNSNSLNTTVHSPPNHSPSVSPPLSAPSVSQSTLEKKSLQLLNMPPTKLTEEEKDFLLPVINKDDLIPLALPKQPLSITDPNIGIRVPFPPPYQIEKNIAVNDAVMSNATTGGSAGKPKMCSSKADQNSISNVNKAKFTKFFGSRSVVLGVSKKGTSTASRAISVKTIVSTPILSASQKQKLLDSVKTKSTITASCSVQGSSSSLAVSPNNIVTTKASKSATASVKTEAALRNKEAAEVPTAGKEIRASKVNIALVTVDDKSVRCGHVSSLEISVPKPEITGQEVFVSSSVEAPDVLSLLPSNESIPSKKADDKSLAVSCTKNLTDLSVSDDTKVNDGMLDSNASTVSSVDNNNTENRSPGVSVEEAASTSLEAKQISVAEVNLLSSTFTDLHKPLHLTVPIDSKASNENEKFFTVDGYSSGVCDSSTELHTDESSKSMMACSSTTIEADISPRSTSPFKLLTNVIENLRVLTSSTEPEVALNIGNNYSFAVEPESESRLEANETEMPMEIVHDDKVAALVIVDASGGALTLEDKQEQITTDDNTDLESDQMICEPILIGNVEGVDFSENTRDSMPSLNEQNANEASAGLEGREITDVSAEAMPLLTAENKDTNE